MKYAEYQIDNNRVEVFNSMLGKEEIVLNGKKVSEKHSFFGARHPLKIGDDNFTIEPTLNILKITGVSFKVYKNGSLIKLKNELSKKMKTELIVKSILAAFVYVFIFFKLGDLLSSLFFH